MIGNHVFYHNLTASNCSCKHESSSLNSIRNNVVSRTVKGLNTFNFNAISSCTLYLCSHFVHEISKVYNLRFLSCILNICSSFCQSSRHHDILSRTHARKIKVDSRTLKTVLRRCGLDIVFLCNYFRSECLKSFKMKPDRSLTYGTSTGHINLSIAGSSQKRSHQQK